MSDRRKKRWVIRAKGCVEDLAFMAGDAMVMAGNELNTIGPSRRNAMHGHNICSDLYKTTFVSFTTNLKTAEKFATADGLSNGYIYVVKTSTLAELGIEYASQKAQVNDEEFEVLVNLAEIGTLPISAILEKKTVQGWFC